MKSTVNACGARDRTTRAAVAAVGAVIARKKRVPVDEKITNLRPEAIKYPIKLQI